MMTRQQQYLCQALQDVEAMKDRSPKTKDIYGGLCHKVPVLIRNNGLCQTLALVEEKAQEKTGGRDGRTGVPTTDDREGAGGRGGRAEAYRQVRSQIAGLLGLPAGDLLARVSSADAGEYVRYTRTLLDAWTYYKRLAVSVLGVEPGAGEEE